MSKRSEARWVFMGRKAGTEAGQKSYHQNRVLQPGDWIALWLGKVPQKRAGSDFPRVRSLVWEDPTRRRASNGVHSLAHALHMATAEPTSCS